MSNLDYGRIRERLHKAFSKAESAVAKQETVNAPAGIQQDIGTVFSSSTQAYREVLLGCVLAKLDDPSTDISKPYSGQSDNAFSGRTLDERVINPFLHEKRVPSSKGPYLSTFRRNVDFTPATRDGLRDKTGYDAFLRLLEYVEESTENAREAFLYFLLARFVQLREEAAIPIAKLNRASLIQYQRLIDGLLNIPSGGRLPVMLVVAMFRTLKAHFVLPWEIDFQGINQADSAMGASGDVTIRDSSKILLAVEVTERVVDKSRVISTFNTKISPEGVEDYIFFVNGTSAHGPATAQAEQYFTQGSEVNFADIRTWLNMSLVTVGKAGRSEFNLQLRGLLDADDTPRSIKVAWNDLVATLTSI